MQFNCTPGPVLSRVWKFAMQEMVISHTRYDGTMTDQFKRVIFDRGDSVGILLFDRTTDEVILTEQFRVGVAANLTNDDSPWVIETVAGSMDVAGEDPMETALREVDEETPGCKVISVIPIISFYPSPGAATEKLHLFCGIIDSSEAKENGGLADHNEDIKVVRMNVTDAINGLDTGMYNTSTAIIAMQWLRQNLPVVRGRFVIRFDNGMYNFGPVGTDVNGHEVPMAEATMYLTEEEARTKMDNLLFPDGTGATIVALGG